ncbi:MAG: hypothetical protein ACIARR_11315 [Phycisphaerales bacterium JB059]
MMMRTELMRRGVVLGAMAGVVSGSLAGPPRLDLVDRDAVWVMHIDFEEAVGSRLGAWCLEQIDREIDDDDFARDLRGDLSWSEDLRGLTLYGWEGEDSVVAVLQGSGRLGALEERLWHGHKFLHGEETFEVEGREIISLSEPGEDDEAINIASVRGEHGGRTLIASPSTAWLGRALRVAEGRDEGLPGNARVLEAASPAEHAMIVVMASELSGIDGFHPVSELARDAGSVWAAVSERDGRMHVRAAATANDEEEAQRVAQVLQGVVALGQLIAGDTDDEDFQELLRLARGLRFDVEGRTIRASIDVDADRVADMMQIHVGGEDDDR